MSKLEELIEQFCPNGVEYKTLGDVDIVNLIMGTSPKGNSISEKSENGIEFHQGKTFFGDQYLKKSHLYTSNPVKIAPAESIIMSVRAPVGDCNITNREIAIGRGLCSLVGKDRLETKFLYYFISANINEFKKKSNGSTFEAINTNDIKSIRFPFPPLEVQREIIRILDNFTELTSELIAELTSELTARKKQYEYYRDELLSSNIKIKLFPLGEIAVNLDSKRKPITKASREKGQYPYYGASGIVDYVKDYIFDGDYLLISEDGANLLSRNTPIAFSISGKNWVNNHAHILKFESMITQRYVEIYLNSIDLSKYISTAAQPKLTQDNLNKIMIPLPEFSEQEKIVEILDTFDSLCNDISEGLSAEIEARQKQYEYYREKLLTFKELKS